MRLKKANIDGRKILVTGAAGFVGSNLIREAISWNGEVYALIRKTSDLWRIRDLNKDITIINVDLADYEKLNSCIKAIHPDIIFHTAVYGGSAEQSDLDTIIKSNIMGTVNMLKSCMHLDFDVFVNTGSSSEYGIKDKPMRESDCLDPITDYGVSKAAATMFCKSKSMSENLPIVTVRLFSPYGPYESGSRLIPSVILSILRGERPVISSRQHVRDFIFIHDVVGAYLSILELEDPGGKIFNIGTGVQHSVGEIVDIILSYLRPGSTYKIGRPPSWRNEPSFWQADISKAKSELRWEPKYSLEKGLTTTIEWFKKNIALYTE